MAEVSNVYIVTEKPPRLGKVTGKKEEAARQIRNFFIQRRKYIRRYKDSNVKIPTLDQMIEEEDLEQLAGVARAMFKREDRNNYPEEYRQRDLEDQESSSDSGASESRDCDDGSGRSGGNLQRDLEDEGDEKQSEEDGTNQNMRTAAQSISERFKLFEKYLFNEESIKRMFRLMYGPKDILQADDLLRQVKMDKNITPYRSLQYSSEYAVEFEETVSWISEFKPDSKALREAFISGIHPPELRRRLTLLRIKKIR